MSDENNLPFGFHFGWTLVCCFDFGILFPLGYSGLPFLLPKIEATVGISGSIGRLLLASAGWSLIGLLLGTMKGIMIARAFPNVSIFYFAIFTGIGFFLAKLTLDFWPWETTINLHAGQDDAPVQDTGPMAWLAGYYFHRTAQVAAAGGLVALLQTIALSAVLRGTLSWFLRSVLAAIVGGFASLALLFMITTISMHAMMMRAVTTPPGELAPEDFAADPMTSFVVYGLIIGVAYGLVFAVITVGAFSFMEPRRASETFD